jgi:hypothetical protein
MKMSSNDEERVRWMRTVWMLKMPPLVPPPWRQRMRGRAVDWLSI